MSTVTKRRPTQEERSAATRARVLEAAIHCLHAFGYSASTTLLVAEEAGISRGAMLHQFPTKTDLMLFVVRSVFDDEVARFRERVKSPKHTDADLFQIVWDTASGAAGVAALEILLGSRSDPQLAERLIPLQSQIEREACEIARSLHPEGGGYLVTVTGVRLIIWVMRGFSIANLIAADRKAITDMVDLFRRITTSYRDIEQRNQGERQKKKSKSSK